jgi:pSer/pThr/pTyr-binding forkhead associated (FHA) protein
VAEVVVELTGKEILRVPLKGPSMTIGRDPQCDLHLDNRALSRRHAQIEKRGAAIWVRDLNSQNGTFVNGERIGNPMALNAGDLVEVGRYQVRIEGVDEASADTPVLTLTGPEGKHRFAMVGEEIIIGRAPSCDIAIGHKSISRRHLRIAIEGDHFIAEDLGSQNGTRLNGKRIAGPTPFERGDQLQMSDFSVEVGFLESAPATSAGRERASKTMMIDRSELAKAAYVDGDFERMKSSAGRLAVGNGDRAKNGHTDDFEVGDDEDSQTRGLPALGADDISQPMPATVPPTPAPTPPAPPPPAAPAAQSNVANAKAAKKNAAAAAAVAAKNGRGGPWITLAHPDISDRDLELGDDVTIIAEDGTNHDTTDGRSYANQGYVVLTRTSAGGVVVSVVGDRRLVSVNGKPNLFQRLAEGDTVEFGLLTVVFHQ